MRSRLNGLAAISLAGMAITAACKSSSSATPDPVVPCDSTATIAQGQPFAAGDVAVHLDVADPLLEPVRADLATYLGELWGGTFAVASTAPDFAKPATIWLSTSDAARAMVGATITDGYAIKRVDAGTSARVVVYAKDAKNLAFGAYALLEELGVRFFHPKQELVPKLASPRLPSQLDITRKPAMASRGLQMHTLHPIEYFAVLNVPSPDNLADAKRVIDWLVKTGQNHLQWVLLATVDFDSWKPHAQAIIDYAHQRGVTVGSAVQVWGGAALQNNYVLVTDAAQWQAQMDAQLDRLMTLPWDVVELALGEFLSTDPQSVIDWLSHATDHVVSAFPNVEVNVQNHVGNYAQLYVQYMGQTVFYYHLPQFADVRLGQSVHTLFFFDVYRNWAMYNHPDFHLQHDYMLKELPTRRVKYFPESAYWVTADVDVPVFLPEYIHARWIDIHGLVADVAQAGLPPLHGHLLFTSGHEWGYWMTDYLTAKMLWEPEQPLDHFVEHYAAAYGSCNTDIATAFTSFMQLQSSFLFDQKLVQYVSGEDNTIDFGYLANIPTHPHRVQFEEVVAMTEDQRTAFEQTVVVAFESMATQVEPLENTVAARCRGADDALKPWCNELWDGMAIVRLRLQHAAHVYRAALSLGRGKSADAASSVVAASHVTDDAAKVIARRESAYRFDVARLTDAYPNPTYYKFGYLHQAHTQCYWRRREEQVQYLIDNGVPEPLAHTTSCDN